MIVAKTVLLALIWVGLSGDYSAANLGFGLALAAVCLALARPLRGPGFARVRLLKLPGFALYFLWAVLLSNLRTVQVVLGPRRLVRPVLVAVPLQVERDLEIMLLACMISLTPGTLSLELSDDRRTLLVHDMAADGPHEVRRQIKEGFERRLLEVFR